VCLCESPACQSIDQASKQASPNSAPAFLPQPPSAAGERRGGCPSQPPSVQRRWSIARWARGNRSSRSTTSAHRKPIQGALQTNRSVRATERREAIIACLRAAATSVSIGHSLAPSSHQPPSPVVCSSDTQRSLWHRIGQQVAKRAMAQVSPIRGKHLCVLCVADAQGRSSGFDWRWGLIGWSSRSDFDWLRKSFLVA